MSFLPNPQPSKARSRYPRWTLRDKTKVRCEDLSDLHLARAIKRMETKAQERWPAFRAQCYDAIGVEAGECGSRDELDKLDDPNGWTVCLHPMHEHLVAEAERRGLDVERLAG